MQSFNFSETWALAVAAVAAVAAVVFLVAGLFEFVQHIIESAKKDKKPEKGE